MLEWLGKALRQREAKAGDIEALEGVGRVFGVVGDMWCMSIGRRCPGVPLSAPRCSMPSGIAWAVSDPLPRPWGGGVLVRTLGSGRPGRCLGMRVPLALAHQRMSLVTLIYAQCDGPIHLIIHFITHKAHGPILIYLYSDWWAHPLNYILCYGWSAWAHSHLFMLSMMGPFTQLYMLLRSEGWAHLLNYIFHYA